MPTCFHGATVVLPDRLADNHSVLVRNGRIELIAPDDTFDVPDGTEMVDVAGRYLGPGFIDIHCHGGGGAWAHDDPATFARHHLLHGTTSVLATTVTMESHAALVSAIATIADAIEDSLVPTVVGINMEGPYLHPDLGAYKEHARLPRAAEYLEFVDAARGHLRIMTIAPELPGTTLMVQQLQMATGGGVVFSVGHSKSSAEEISLLVSSGLRLATHVTNASGCAISPTRYEGTREVGVDEAVMLDDEITAEVVVDRAGRHVRADMLRLILKTKGRDGVVLVTDATAADGAPPAGGIVSDAPSDVNYNATGGLAGSALTMDGALGNLMRHTGVGIVDAWRMASRNPASVLGLLDDRGEIKTGRRADLLVLNHSPGEDVAIDQIWLAGVRVDKERPHDQ
ncbi:N-acetylglucosamine-6-phosphate deacetylase [Tessaracoccus sp.]